VGTFRRKRSYGIIEELHYEGAGVALNKMTGSGVKLLDSVGNKATSPGPAAEIIFTAIKSLMVSGAGDIEAAA
jgi:hypothetical protein